MLSNIIVNINCCKFRVRKFLFGFENANQMMKYVDKQSLEKILKKNGACIGKNCDIETGLTFHNCTDYKNLKIGDNSHIGKNCFFDLADSIQIGANAVISMNASFLTHINIKRSKLELIYPSKTAPIVIGNDCYVGANSVILMGVSLGEYCFAAACSTVTKSFDAKSFIAGTPAIFKKQIDIK
ncbi:MAG: acyltransferase [Ignavibacteria bacterium]|nr:acyltransferase [Ignavibacteria bacterium]